MRTGTFEQLSFPDTIRHLVATLMVGLVLAGCSAGSATPPGASVADSTATDPPPSAAATPSASQSAFPSGQGIGDPIGPPELSVGDWVVSTVEGLRLREEPGLDGASIGMLRLGFEGTVVDGPRAVDGYEWVHVAWPGLPAGSGCATGPDADGYLSFCGASGWVATADREGNAWLAATDPECPETPKTVADASRIQPGIRLACFAGKELTLTGFIAPEASGRGCYPRYAVEPAWLGPCAVAFLQGEESRFDATATELAVNVDPGLGACNFGGTSPDACPFAPLSNTWVIVTGAVDHPAAESCVIEPLDGNDQAPDPATAIYECRARFVVSTVGPGSPP